MSDIKKAAAGVAAQAMSEEELALINKQSLKVLTAEEVFPFKLAAADNRVDRDMERFSDKALADMAALFVGKTVICDHQWSATKQTARIYAGSVEDSSGGVKRLMLRCYMLRTPETSPTIDAIEGGILRECSVGCAGSRLLCSVCGEDMRDRTKCAHQKGRTYDGKRCYGVYEGVTDAYEVSFVAVPSQPAAGVVKHYSGEGPVPEDPADETGGNHGSSEAVALRCRLLATRAKMFSAAINHNKDLEERT